MERLRFMQHVLPTGIKHIRHYGVLVSSCKAVKLDAARLAFQMPAVNPQAVESAHAFMARALKLDVASWVAVQSNMVYLTSATCCAIGNHHSDVR